MFALPLICRSALAVLAAAIPLLAGAETFEARDICRCYVTDMSDDGLAVTGMMAGSFQTFRWTWQGGAKSLGRGTERKLQVSGGTPAISRDGSVVAATIIDSTNSYGTQGRWTAEGGWQQLMPPRPADGAVVDFFDGSVFGMSRDGRVITGLYERNTGIGGNAHGSRWTEGGHVEDMGSGGYNSRIDGANGDGSVLVGWDEHPVYGTRRAAVWVNGVRTVLEDTDWPSEATTVNTAGTIIAGRYASSVDYLTHAAMWIWDGSQWVRKDLGVLQGTHDGGMAAALGMTDDGSVVVGIARRYFSPVNRGFVWTAAEGMVDAEKYFKDRGYNAHRKLAIESVPAISRDGSVMAIEGTEVATGQLRSIAVRSVAAAR